MITDQLMSLLHYNLSQRLSNHPALQTFWPFSQ